jgi:hypothetical protein
VLRRSTIGPSDDGTIRRFIEHSAIEHASILEGQMDQFTSAQRRLAAELHDGRLTVGRIEMNGVSNRHDCSIASSDDAASFQCWWRYAIPGRAIGSRLCNVIAKGTASTCAYPRDGADQSRSVSKTGQYDAHLFGDLWRQGGDLTGPGMIARSARAGHDGQTLDHEPTAHVLALRADDWERLTGVWQEAALSVFTSCGGDVFQAQAISWGKTRS